MTTTDLTAPTGVAALSAAVQAALGTLPAPSGVQYLKMNQADDPVRAGQLTYGVDGTVVLSTDQWICDPLALEHGYLAYKGESVVPEDIDLMAPITEPLPGTQGGKPIPELAADIKLSPACLGIFVKVHPQPSVEVEFSGRAVGTMRAFRAILTALSAQLQADHQGAIFPVVSWSVEAYHNRRFQKTIYNPVPTVIGWLTAEQAAQYQPEPASAGSGSTAAAPTGAQADAPAAQAAPAAPAAPLATPAPPAPPAPAAAPVDVPPPPAPAPPAAPVATPPAAPVAAPPPTPASAPAAAAPAWQPPAPAATPARQPPAPAATPAAAAPAWQPPAVIPAAPPPPPAAAPVAAAPPPPTPAPAAGAATPPAPPAPAAPAAGGRRRRRA